MQDERPIKVAREMQIDLLIPGCKAIVERPDGIYLDDMPDRPKTDAMQRWITGGEQLSEAEMRAEIEFVRELRLGWLPSFSKSGTHKMPYEDAEELANAEPVFWHGPNGDRPLEHIGFRQRNSQVP